MVALYMQGAGVGQYKSEDRNLILNGDMFIDQANEGASVTLASGTESYIVDGAAVKMVQSVASVAAQQTADAPPGFINSLKITTTTGNAVGAGDYLYVRLPIEGQNCRFLGFGGANAGTVSLSFWVKTSVANSVFAYSIQNSAGNRSYNGTVTITSASVWTQVVIPAISGDITGTWLTTNGIGINLFITVASGATNQSATTGAWKADGKFASTSQTNGVLTTDAATFQVTGVQLEQGSTVNPFSLLPYDVSLAHCRRYLQKSFPAGTAPAQSAGVGNAVTVKNPIALGDPSKYVQFIPPLRATPTVTTYNPSAANANWRNITAGADSTVSVDPATTIGSKGVLIATSGTVTTLGDVLAIHYLADARL